MSVEISISLVCDGCGIKVTPPSEYRTTHIKDPLREARILAGRDGWTSVNRGRFLPKAHYCYQCSDKPIRPIQKPIRRKLKLTREDMRRMTSAQI